MTGRPEESPAAAIFTEMVRQQRHGVARGLYAACTASPFAIRAVLRQAREDRAPALIESTAGQVNLAGGYSGLTPMRFGRQVHRMAADLGMAPEGVILGGDHLGPHTWRHENAACALDKAAELASACVAAGYRKLHLDTSIACRDDSRAADGALPLEVISRRAAHLCRAAEETARAAGSPPPWYVIGSDVPSPGGRDMTGGAPPLSDAGSVRETVSAHRRAFHASGLGHAWPRVFAVVVCTGADFSPDVVHAYDSRRVGPLVAAIGQEQELVFEAHSTDFQTPAALARMVADHFGILKVGPALTYAMREALFILAAIETEILVGRRGAQPSRLPETMEHLMLKTPGIWQPYYRGTEAQQAHLRQHAYSDRIRYYWFHPQAMAAVQRLMTNLHRHPPTGGLLDKYLPEAARKIREGRLAWDPEGIVLDRIGAVAAGYARACRPAPAGPASRDA